MALANPVQWALSETGRVYGADTERLDLFLGPTDGQTYRIISNATPCRTPTPSVSPLLMDRTTSSNPTRHQP